MNCKERHINCNLGFTLIELSIVLVIISLIVGGVIGGKALITAAKIKSIISEATAIRTAANTFQLQYDQLPGDFSEATDYWPSAPNIRDGNGSGQIAGANLTTNNGLPFGDAYESQSAFQHLSLAEIIPGTYNRTYSIPSEDGGPFMVSSYEGAEWQYYYFHGSYLYQAPANYIIIGGRSGFYRINETILPVKIAVAIDKRIDDGKPGFGNVKAFDGNSDGECVDGNWYTTPQNIVYHLGTEELCQLAFKYD